MLMFLDWCPSKAGRQADMRLVQNKAWQMLPSSHIYGCNTHCKCNLAKCAYSLYVCVCVSHVGVGMLASIICGNQPAFRHDDSDIDVSVGCSMCLRIASMSAMLPLVAIRQFDRWSMPIVECLFFYLIFTLFAHFYKL